MKVSFIKCVKNDFLLFIFCILSVISIGFLLSYIYAPEQIRMFNLEPILRKAYGELERVDIGMGIFEIVLILFSLIFCIKKYLYFKSFENDYIEVHSSCVYFIDDKDRFGIDYEYSFNNQSYVKHFTLMHNKETDLILNNPDVVLVIKIDNPKEALIKDLYFR